MKCLIISGGKFDKISIRDKYDLIIACDKGYLYAEKLKIIPDIIVGDFDSAKMPKSAKNIIAVDSVKDDTDTGLAIKYAIRNGHKKIDIICALGKRLDHTLANISLMKYIIESGGSVKIISKELSLYAFGRGKVKLKKEDDRYLSIFSLSDKTKIDYIKGTKYDIKNTVLKNSFPLGISNEFKNKYAEISVGKGIILVISIKKDR